jgi:ABC-type transporter Mla maintaining outer membrane lipid asymmetry ATPase subunit MlaF
VFVNLVTGAMLPDAGHIAMFGRASASIQNSDEWLTVVDRFGIVSDRAVLLEQLTVAQNLAMPFTLDIEPPPQDVRVRAAALAIEVGVPEAMWPQPVSAVDALNHARVRLGRALALDPSILLLEHASASLDRAAAPVFADDVRRVAERRGMAFVAVTADESFARGLGARVLRLEPATGRLKEESRRFGWLRGRLG